MTRVRVKSVVHNPVEKADGSPLPFLGLEDLESGTGRLLVDELPLKAAEDSVKHQVGDVLFSKLRPYLAKSYLPKEPGTATGELLVLRPSSKVNPRYLFYVTLSRPWIEWANATAYGTKMPRTSWDLLGEYRMWLPPLEEQRRIADFLDAETARIDRLIQTQQRVASLLSERDQVRIELALCQRATGRVKLKRLLLEPLSYGANAPAEYDNTDWPRYIRTTDIASDGSLRADTFASLPPSVAKGYELYDGDLLFVRSGATVGKSLMYQTEFGPAAHAGYLIKARLNPAKALPKFVWYFCQTSSYWQQISEGAIQATIQNVNAEKYGNLLIPEISLDEQRRAVDQLDRELEKSHELTARVSRQIELLTERRQALITAAVTGQIDVSTASGRGIEDGLR